MRHLLILASVFATVMEQSLRAEDKRPQRQPIIDMHMHVYAADERWELRIPNPVTKQPMAATDEEAHREATKREMDRFMIGCHFEDPREVDLDELRREEKGGDCRRGEIAPQYQANNSNTLRELRVLTSVNAEGWR